MLTIICSYYVYILVFYISLFIHQIQILVEICHCIIDVLYFHILLMLFYRKKKDAYCHRHLSVMQFGLILQRYVLFVYLDVRYILQGLCKEIWQESGSSNTLKIYHSFCRYIIVWNKIQAFLFETTLLVNQIDIMQSN